MNLKKTIHAVSFVAVATISSLALAQGVGVGVGAGVGAGSSSSGAAAAGSTGGKANVGVQGVKGTERSTVDAKAAADANVRNQEQKAAREKRDAEAKASFDARVKAQRGN